MTDPDQAVFHRPELATRLVADLLEPPAASPVRSGLFLAAPRRTGKSTFLIADLVPALRAAGAHVLYIDLWEDPAKDPAQAIVEAVGASVADEKRAAAKLVRAIGRIETVSAAGMVTVSLRRPDGGVVDVSLTRALKALSETIERTIVLIVDEAQQAITTDAGSRAMFALKAARDALNIARPHGLRIVATGSNRDKLAMLRSAKDQAFYGAPLTRFPPLGEGYVRWALERHGLIDVLELATAVELFDRCGHEPEILNAALGEIAYGTEAEDTATRLEATVDALLREADLVRLRQVLALPALQGAVLHEMASAGDAYAPFHVGTRERYARRMSDSADVPGESSVQSALTALQRKGLVWRASRGVYALEDERMRLLMRARDAQG